MTKEEKQRVLRNIPLENVLHTFEEQGLVRRDGRDKNNWRTVEKEGRITVTEDLFYDHHAEKGKRGSIDLVIHILDCSYGDAKKWLETHYGHVLTSVRKDQYKHLPQVESGGGTYGIPSSDPNYSEKVAKRRKEEFAKHQPSARNWNHVKRYLNKRGLSDATIDNLHDQGSIWSDSRNNLVIKMDNGSLVLRGTHPNRPFFRNIGESKGQFTLTGKGKDIALVEAPIDAFSLHEMGFEGTVVAVLGNADVKGIADYWKNEGYKIIPAFDNDKVGFSLGQKTNIPQSEWLVPTAKDWNEDLQNGESLKEKGYFVETKEQQEILEQYLLDNTVDIEDVLSKEKESLQVLEGSEKLKVFIVSNEKEREKWEKQFKEKNVFEGKKVLTVEECLKLDLSKFKNIYIADDVPQESIDLIKGRSNNKAQVIKKSPKDFPTIYVCPKIEDVKQLGFPVGTFSTATVIHREHKAISDYLIMEKGVKEVSSRKPKKIFFSKNKAQAQEQVEPFQGEAQADQEEPSQEKAQANQVEEPSQGEAQANQVEEASQEKTPSQEEEEPSQGEAQANQVEDSSQEKNPSQEEEEPSQGEAQANQVEDSSQEKAQADQVEDSSQEKAQADQVEDSSQEKAQADQVEDSSQEKAQVQAVENSPQGEAQANQVEDSPQERIQAQEEAVETMKELLKEDKKNHSKPTESKKTQVRALEHEGR